MCVLKPLIILCYMCVEVRGHTSQEYVLGRLSYLTVYVETISLQHAYVGGHISLGYALSA